MGHLHFLLDEMGLDKMGWCKLINALDRMGPFHIFFRRNGIRQSGKTPFERNNAIEICNGMMFDFYPGLNLSVNGDCLTRQLEANLGVCIWDWCLVY